jgi:hypothetical protein
VLRKRRAGAEDTAPSCLMAMQSLERELSAPRHYRVVVSFVCISFESQSVIRCGQNVWIIASLSSSIMKAKSR